MVASSMTRSEIDLLRKIESLRFIRHQPDLPGKPVLQLGPQISVVDNNNLDVPVRRTLQNAAHAHPQQIDPRAFMLHDAGCARNHDADFRLANNVEAYAMKSMARTRQNLARNARFFQIIAERALGGRIGVVLCIAA